MVTCEFFPPHSVQRNPPGRLRFVLEEARPHRSAHCDAGWPRWTDQHPPLLAHSGEEAAAPQASTAAGSSVGSLLAAVIPPRHIPPAPAPAISEILGRGRYPLQQVAGALRNFSRPSAPMTSGNLASSGSPFQQMAGALRNFGHHITGHAAVAPGDMVAIAPHDADAIPAAASVTAGTPPPQAQIARGGESAQVSLSQVLTNSSTFSNTTAPPLQASLARRATADARPRPAADGEQQPGRLTATTAPKPLLAAVAVRRHVAHEENAAAAEPASTARPTPAAILQRASRPASLPTAIGGATAPCPIRGNLKADVDTAVRPAAARAGTLASSSAASSAITAATASATAAVPPPASPVHVASGAKVAMASGAEAIREVDEASATTPVPPSTVKSVISPATVLCEGVPAAGEPEEVRFCEAMGRSAVTDLASEKTETTARPASTLAAGSAPPEAFPPPPTAHLPIEAHALKAGESTGRANSWAGEKKMRDLSKNQHAIKGFYMYLMSQCHTRCRHRTFHHSPRREERRQRQHPRLLCRMRPVPSRPRTDAPHVFRPPETRRRLPLRHFSSMGFRRRSPSPRCRTFLRQSITSSTLESAWLRHRRLVRAILRHWLPRHVQRRHPSQKRRTPVTAGR